MSILIDYSGIRQGMLYISHRVKKDRDVSKHETWWMCSCDCGNILPLSQTQIKKGRKDCGCITPIRGYKKQSPTKRELPIHKSINQFLYHHRIVDANP